MVIDLIFEKWAVDVESNTAKQLPLLQASFFFRCRPHPDLTPGTGVTRTWTGTRPPLTGSLPFEPATWLPRLLQKRLREPVLFDALWHDPPQQ